MKEKLIVDITGPFSTLKLDRSESFESLASGEETIFLAPKTSILETDQDPKKFRVIVYEILGG